MKRALAFFLALLLVAPAALAAEDAFPYHASDWAREEVSRAAALGLIYDPYGHFSDLRAPVTRGDFASNSAALVAKGFGKDLEGYVLIMRYRGQVEDPAFTYSAIDAAADLGILQGRGDGTQDYDRDAHITRQEAAAMLARTYRACQSAEPDVPEPVSFTDREDIADWALEDVALMSRLGIMKGVGDGRFDPLGEYTQEQCILSLLRLYEAAPFDGAGREDPFSIRPEPGFLYTEYQSELCFALEREDCYICAMLHPTGGWSFSSYDICVIGEDLSVRTYKTPIISHSDSFRGVEYARPEYAALSEDGGKLIYTATLEEDVYHIETGVEEADWPLLFEKGVYTVTMDMATGEQTWTRAELGNG